MAPFDDDYRELIVEARDAVLKLFDASEPDAWRALRIGYGQLRDVLERDDNQRGRQAVDDVSSAKQAAAWDQHAERERRRSWWRKTTRAYRESLVIEVLGEEHLMLSAIAQRVEEKLGWSDGQVLYTSHLNYTVQPLLASGQLDRVKNKPQGGENREFWHYFRKPGLEGPIADLEQALGTNGEPQ